MGFGFSAQGVRSRKGVASLVFLVGFRVQGVA